MNLINKYDKPEINEFYKNSFVTRISPDITKVIVTIIDEPHDNTELDSINVHNVMNYNGVAFNTDAIYEVKEGFPGGFIDNRGTTFKRTAEFSLNNFKETPNAAVLKEEIVTLDDTEIKVVYAYLNTSYVEDLVSKGLRGIGVCGKGLTLYNKVLTMTEVCYLWYEVKK